MAIRSLSASVSELASTFAGELLQPQDPGYDLARRVHNGLIDRRPALIARCGGKADIVDAVKLAQEHGLEVAVRGGGHNVAGRCTTDSGLMIDLAAMTGIRVDQQSRTAHAQGGVTWGLFNRETQLHGLATTGGVISTTGIAGLSLGGGVGWLMSRHGLSIDNLLSVDLVLADGRAVTASAQENPDLFWAVRGGGGNFGVASSLVPPASGRPDDYRRRHRLPIQPGMGCAAQIPRHHRLTAGRADGGGRADPCARRVWCQGGGDGGLSLRLAGRW